MGLLATLSGKTRRDAPEIGLTADGSASQLSWQQMLERPEYRGRWLALADCRYHEQSGRATHGVVVDQDDDLAQLCNRVRDAHRHCAIVFCAERSEIEPSFERPSRGH